VVALIKRNPTQVAKETVISCVAQSQRNDQVICSTSTAKGTIMEFKIVGNFRIRRRGTTHPSQRVNLMVVPLLSLMVVLIMVMFVECASDDAKWILDCACPYHVCINRALFSTYESL
jgi:hypothetical protein